MQWNPADTGAQQHGSAFAGSLIDLLQALTRTPSRGGGEDCGAIFALIARWLAAHGVNSEILGPPCAPLALTGSLGNGRESRRLLLNAPADTAGFGDRATWHRDPVSGDLDAGWLFGRGSADSKAGIAIFCHLLAAFATRPRGPAALSFLFDADEHSGGFGGMRVFLDQPGAPIAGAFIGYPGLDRIRIGARGFWRARITVHGTAAHSGASANRGANAVVKAAALVSGLEQSGHALNALASGSFRLPPRLTVTGISGGGEFSMVPDRATLEIDVRLTPNFGADAADAYVRAVVEGTDRRIPTGAATAIAACGNWPAYRLDPDTPLAGALACAAESVLGVRPSLAVAGPSNVGNLLALRGIPAICGFGVAYRDAHAPNECVDTGTLVPVYRTYDMALRHLLMG